jgi:hypothetical protein
MLLFGSVSLAQAGSRAISEVFVRTSPCRKGNQATVTLSGGPRQNPLAVLLHHRSLQKGQSSYSDAWRRSSVESVGSITPALVLAEGAIELQCRLAEVLGKIRWQYYSSAVKTFFIGSLAKTCPKQQQTKPKMTSFPEAEVPVRLVHKGAVHVLHLQARVSSRLIQVEIGLGTFGFVVYRFVGTVPCRQFWVWFCPALGPHPLRRIPGRMLPVGA